MNNRKKCIKDTIIYPIIIEPVPLLFNKDPMDKQTITDILLDYTLLETDENNNMIINSATGEPVVMDGKVLLYDDGTSPRIDFNTQMLFSIDSYKMVKFMFDYYLERLQDDGIYFPVYDIEHLKEDNRLKRLTLLDERYHILYTSRYYYSTVLIFIETIYRMNGDFTIFDEIDSCY